MVWATVAALGTAAAHTPSECCAACKRPNCNACQREIASALARLWPLRAVLFPNQCAMGGASKSGPPPQGAVILARIAGMCT